MLLSLWSTSQKGRRFVFTYTRTYARILAALTWGHVENVTPKRTYLLVCGALLLLTLTTYSASQVNLGLLQTPVGLGIAAIKAALIALFFMNARFSTGITRIVIIGGILWLSILLIGTMDDYITRGWLGVPGK